MNKLIVPGSARQPIQQPQSGVNVQTRADGPNVMITVTSTMVLPIEEARKFADGIQEAANMAEVVREALLNPQVTIPINGRHS